jgi:hypothetical protein
MKRIPTPFFGLLPRGKTRGDWTEKGVGILFFLAHFLHTV